MASLNIANYGTNEEPLFKAKEVGKLLGIKDVKSTIRNFDNVDVESLLLKDRMGRNQQTHVLTMTGLEKLLCNSRKPLAIQLSDALNIKTSIKIVSKETQFMYQLMIAFKGEIMLDQHSVDKYRIDLYFPDYKLAIEFDEQYGHDAVSDEKRQSIISDALGCSFIRVNEKDDIFESINKVYTFIKNYKNEQQ